MNRLKAVCLVLVVSLPGVALALAGETLISENVSFACATSSQTILLARNGSIFTYDVPSGQLADWNPELDPQQAGWAGTGEIRKLSFNGGKVLFMIDLIPPVEEMYGMTIPSPVGIYSSNADGTGTRLLALTRASSVGDIDLLFGGNWVAGSGFSRSAPEAERYLDYVTGEMAFELLPESNMISTADGSRYQLEELQLASDHVWCPYAARVLEGGESPAIAIVDTEVPAVDSVLPIGESYPGIEVQGWVGTDALTASYHGTKGLLFTDGRFAPLPGADWIVYLWLSDGSYVFSTDGGATVARGPIDWSTLDASQAPLQEGLEAYAGPALKAIPGSSARLLHLEGGSLRLITLTE